MGLSHNIVGLSSNQQIWGHIRGKRSGIETGGKKKRRREEEKEDEEKESICLWVNAVISKFVENQNLVTISVLNPPLIAFIVT